MYTLHYDRVYIAFHFRALYTNQRVIGVVGKNTKGLRMNNKKQIHVTISQETRAALHAAKNQGESYHGVVRRLLGLPPIGTSAVYVEKLRQLAVGQRIVFPWRFRDDGSVASFESLIKAVAAVARETGWMLFEKNVNGGWEVYRHA